MSQQSSQPNKVTHIEPPLPSASLFIWIIGIGLFVLLAWAWLFQLEEVSTGTGKVVPSSKEQTIQSLEGGILTAQCARRTNCTTTCTTTTEQ